MFLHKENPSVTGKGPMNDDTSTITFLDELNKKMSPDVLNIKTGMGYGEQRKYVSARIPEELGFKTLELMMLTDVQWGNKCCKKKVFIDYRDWVLSEPNRFVLLGGDMVECSTLLSKGMPFDDDQTPIEQIYDFCNAVAPLRHRILGYVAGNHERHTRPSLGGSAGSFIATHLKIPYSEGQQFIDIYFGKWNPVKNSLWHGGGGSRTKGAKAQVLDRFMSQGDSTFYWTGHLHDCIILPSWRVERNMKGREIGLRKIYGLMSSSFLEFHNSYAEIAAFSPTDTMMTRAIIEPDGHCEVTAK